MRLTLKKTTSAICMIPVQNLQARALQTVNPQVATERKLKNHLQRAVIKSRLQNQRPKQEIQALPENQAVVINTTPCTNVVQVRETQHAQPFMR